MGKRQKQWAREKRDELFVLLGGQCVDCGATEKLEFDVIIPNGRTKNDNAAHHQMEWSHRMSYYRGEYDRGNLALRCEKCNRRKKDDLHFNPNLIEHPF